MKTCILAIIATVAITLSLLSGSTSNEVNHNADNNSEHLYPAICCLHSPILEDEPYVNDIPFDTKEIVENLK